MAQMLLPAVAENCNIVDVCMSKVLTVSEDMVHPPLECGWSIVQAKGHHYKLKQAKWSGKHCLLKLSWLQRRHGVVPHNGSICPTSM